MKEFFTKFYNKNRNNPPSMLGSYTPQNTFSSCLDSINEKLGALGYINMHLAGFSHAKEPSRGTSFYNSVEDEMYIGYRYRGLDVHFMDTVWYRVKLDKQWRKVEESTKDSKYREIIDIQLNILKDYLNECGDVYNLSSTTFWTKPNKCDNLIKTLAEKYNYLSDDEFKKKHSIESNVEHSHLVPKSKLDENASLLEKLCEKYYLDNYYNENKKYKMWNHYDVFVTILQNLVYILKEEGYINLVVRTFMRNDSEWEFSTYYPSSNCLTLRYKHADSNTLSSIDLNTDFSIKKLGYNSDNSISLKIFINILKDYIINQDRFDELINSAVKDRNILLALADKYNLTKEIDYIEFPEATRYNLCTEYIPVKDIWKIPSKEKNSILKLKSSRKNSKKIEEYIILDRDDEGTIAVKSLKDDKILFLQDYNTIENSYDALFYETRQEVRGWKNKAREVVL